MKVNLNCLYYISFILIFFPMFVIYVKKGTNGNIIIGLIFLILLYLLTIFRDLTSFKKFLNRIINLPVTKYYLYYIVFVALTTIVHIILGRYTAPIPFYAVKIYKVVVAATLVYFIPIIGIYLNIKLNNILKLFYTFIWYLLVICIIQYFAFIFDIGFIKVIFDFFTNARDALYLNSESIKLAFRVHGFFSEPSELGQFIFITMPLIFNICTTKYKIYKNKILNLIVKKSMIPLMLVVVIFTKSPIYLVLCFIEFFILLFLHNLKFIKKHIVIILISIFIFIITLIAVFGAFKSEIDQTFLFRIINTIYSIGDFEKLVLLEPSLATRIVSYTIQLVGFTKNMLFGCGLCNVDVLVNPFYLKEMPLPITPENYYRGYLPRSYIAGVNKSIVYTSLAEFGLIGFYLYVIFIYKNIKFIKKLNKYFFGIQKVCLDSTFQMFVSMVVLSFYNLYFTASTMWLVYGFVLMFLYEFYKNRVKNKED